MPCVAKGKRSTLAAAAGRSSLHTTMVLVSMVSLLLLSVPLVTDAARVGTIALPNGAIDEKDDTADSFGAANPRKYVRYGYDGKRLLQEDDEEEESDVNEEEEELEVGEMKNSKKNSEKSETYAPKSQKAEKSYYGKAEKSGTYAPKSQKAEKGYYGKANKSGTYAPKSQKAGKGDGSRYYYCVVAKQSKNNKSISTKSNEYYNKASKSSKQYYNKASKSAKQYYNKASKSAKQYYNKASKGTKTASVVSAYYNEYYSGNYTAGAFKAKAEKAAKQEKATSVPSSKSSKSEKATSVPSSKSSKNSYYTKAEKSGKSEYYESKGTKSKASKDSKSSYYQDYYCSGYYSRKPTSSPSPTRQPIAETITAPPIGERTRQPVAETITAPPIGEPTRQPVAETITAPPIPLLGSRPTPTPEEEPTRSPVSETVTPPPNSRPNRCLDDVQLMRQLGSYPFQDSAVEVVDRDLTSMPRTVTVNLNQPWSIGTIDHIFTYYHQSPFEKKCYENSSVEEGHFETITIACNYLQPIAYLEYCVADSLEKSTCPLTIEDDAKVPDCCYPTFPPETPAVCYSLKISCEPCETTAPVESPTLPPVEETVTEPPVSPTGRPSASLPPVEETVTEPPVVPRTGAPTAPEPTDAPVTEPSPVGEPTKTSCECDVNDEEALTFKCGKDMYICPGVTQICSVSPAKGSLYYDITQEQCDEMKTVEVGEKCVPLPQHGIIGTSGPDGAKGLSHRDCYNDFAPNGMKEDGSCDICKNSFPYVPTWPGEEDNPTDAPVTVPAGPEPVDPGTFCHALNDRDECGLTGPGSCAVQPGPRSEKYPDGEPSCGIGVPEGYYPDLTRCDAYCFCTGTAAPSRYEIVNTGTLYDHINNWSYLPGQWGKDGGNGAYGTEGGIPVHSDGGMSYEGTLRPPGTCGPPQKCNGPNDNSMHPYNGCAQYFQCENGKAHKVQDCGPGTLFNGSICDHAYNVKCEVP